MTFYAETFRKMCLSAANMLDNKQVEINNLNVFPVPDGDTGINMCLTMRSIDNVAASDTLSDCAHRIADRFLRSARGNSGAILSLFFRGMSKSFDGMETADAKAMAAALTRGTQEAYRAVGTPTEGTILTVMRETSEAAEAEYANFDEPVAFFERLVECAEASLDRTPDILPVLKEAGVVDAGGRGFVEALKGMLASLKGEDIICENRNTVTEGGSADFSQMDTNSITFAYCTECIVAKSDKYRGEGKAEAFKKTITPIGDSMVFVDDNEIIKVHIHTNDPGKVLSTAVKYGELETVKIENMKRQHSNLAGAAQAPAQPAETKSSPKQPAPLVADYGFVAVCLGNGIQQAFRDLGVTQIVSGGQTMNPSTDDILKAARATQAKKVFVFPNNKNILMVANQAAEIMQERSKRRSIIVIPTTSVPQAMSAMLVFDETASAEANKEAMCEAIKHVRTLSITRAVRNVQIGALNIHRNEFLGLKEGKIVKAGKVRDDIVISMLGKKRDFAFLTLIYGANVTEAEANILADRIHKMAPKVDISMIAGGQPLYDYVIALE